MNDQDMNGDGNLEPRPSPRRSMLSRVGIPAALVAGGLVGGAVLAGTLTAGASTVTHAVDTVRGYAAGEAGGAADAPVTGDELAKVTAAVKARDSAVTVTSVRKDPDGSYDVFATKSGATLMFEVSADLKTIAPGGAGHSGGGRGGAGRNGSADTAVTGAELAKVTAAVKAKDSAITVTSVRKDPDGSYDVFGTKLGSRVMYDMSADLTTLTQNTHGAGRPGNGASTPSGSTT